MIICTSRIVEEINEGLWHNRFITVRIFYIYSYRASDWNLNIFRRRGGEIDRPYSRTVVLERGNLAIIWFEDVSNLVAGSRWDPD